MGKYIWAKMERFEGLLCVVINHDSGEMQEEQGKRVCEKATKVSELV